MRVTIGDVKSSLGITNTYDIVNAIRNSEGDKFQQYVPLADAENVAEVGQGIIANPSIRNNFIEALVDRIGLVVLRDVQLKNPLGKFKQGNMPQGRTIEEIFTDITKAHKYDPEEAETKVFERQIPNVHTLFHERDRQEFYKQTIQDDSLTSAFTSWNKFNGFITGIINAIYNSAEVDEYEYMKLLIDNYYSKGLFTIVDVDKPESQSKSNEFIKKVRATARKMSLPTGSRNYNALAVQTRTDMQDMHMIIDADLEAQLDVDVLANAFHMDKADFLGNVTVIDGFASKGLEAVLIDRDWFMVYDNLQTLETLRNPQGLYWNYYFHVWQTLSASRFSNAVAFVSEDVPKVSQVIVDPAILKVKAGHEKELKAIVRSNDGSDYQDDISWDVEGINGTDLEDDTEIDSDGKLKVAEDQEGTLQVTAKVTYDNDDDEEKEVKGESIVTVV